MSVEVNTSDKFHPSDNMESLTFLADKVDQIYDTPLTNELVKAVLNVVGELREAYTLIGTEWAEGMERGASLDEALPTAEIAGASPASIPIDDCDAGYACDESDIDQMMADEIDAKGDELWEQGAREVLGDKEFERLYPELKRRRGFAIASGFDPDSDPELLENIERLNRQ